MKTLLAAITLILTLTACTTVVNRSFEPTGGSKADGNLFLALQYNGNEEVHWNWGEANYTAITRCRAWGYKSATRFNDGSDQCTHVWQYGCLTYQRTVQYQCTT